MEKSTNKLIITRSFKKEEFFKTINNAAEMLDDITTEALLKSPSDEKISELSNSAVVIVENIHKYIGEKIELGFLQSHYEQTGEIPTDVRKMQSFGEDHRKDLRTIQAEESRMYNIIRSSTKLTDGIMFDIDAHKLVALQFLTQSKESVHKGYGPGKSLDDAKEHIDRIEQLVDFYTERK